LFEHGLFGKPVSIFPDHALVGLLAIPAQAGIGTAKWRVYRDEPSSHARGEGQLVAARKLNPPHQSRLASDELER